MKKKIFWLGVEYNYNFFNFNFYCIVNKSLEFLFFLKKSYNLFFMLNFFKNSLNFVLKFIIDITVVDYVNYKSRFKLVYNFNSFLYKKKFIIIFSLFFLQKALSIYTLFRASIWLEREIFDMFGIIFFNNKDLRRILTDYTFFGHPLRKDFPLTGYYEVVFSESLSLIIEKKIELMQELRFYQVSSFLEGWDLQKF